jgi:hypothetical protein
MVNENTPLVKEIKREGEEGLSELKPILTTLVSLSDKVVVFDLDKEK